MAYWPIDFPGIEDDPFMEFGQVRVEGDTHYMTWETYRTVARAVGIMQEYFDLIDPLGEGTHEIPIGALMSDTARQLTLAMSVYRPGDNTCCVMPGCWQDPTEERHGFPLCAHHASILQSWDEILES
jgi:hypothetical protein